MAISKWLWLLLLCAGVAACNSDELHPDEVDNPAASDLWCDHRVAVILPMNDGLDVRWMRTLEMAARNIDLAFRNQPENIHVRLLYEWYDESTANLAELSSALAKRDDVVALIGGMYSAHAQVMASPFARAGKPFFTLATTEELVRAHAGSGHLWAMTETDITQCEVLLAKALYYGAKSVALIANGEDAYGKTFIDWFAFQANELGLEVKGVFRYAASTLDESSSEAMASGADYVVCVASAIADIRPMLEASKRHALLYGRAPRMLFSDTGYGANVLQTTGSIAEGLEGVTFGASPESGFEVSYEVFFGTQASLGEAQVYDAAMLLGYALCHRLLHPAADLKEALRQVVSGREPSAGSWMEEGMRLVVDALCRGEHPDVRGASGSLDFDAKVFTNVLHTTYYSYKVYNSRYIILDYTTSDGSKRTDATLAGWNRKAQQLQDFDDTSDQLTYPPLREKWALLVAASHTWNNYRHQADVLAMYQLLRKQGYADERIVLVAEDDLAYSSRNPQPGTIQIRVGGENVYHDVLVDYHPSDLSPADIGAILNGERSDRLPQVIAATAEDNVLVFWSGHGNPGELCWMDEAVGFTASLARETFGNMSEQKRFRKLLCLIETCYSGLVAQGCEGIPGALFITAASAQETSKADIFSDELGVWMSNRFTATLQEQLQENPSIALRELYYRLFINTVGSHVMLYNASRYGNIYRNGTGEFL
jgi:ABC-type branched-subunit amino acid transport system substrate-binding protein